MRRVGVDTYSYHRLLGEVRPGEIPPPGTPWTWRDALDAALLAGADVVAMETCFMGESGALDASELTRGVDSAEIMLSWGHPYGLEYGISAAAEDDLLSWLGVASIQDHAVMRVVLAHPHLRDEERSWDQVRSSVDAVRRMTRAAEEAGVILAIENHADVTGDQLNWLMEEIASPYLSVCFDIANAVRVGDDPLEAALLLSPHIVAVHAKDISDEEWHPRSGPKSVPLGHGVLPVGQIVRVVSDSRPQCRFLVEIAHVGPHEADDQALVEQDIDWLRALLGS